MRYPTFPAILATFPLVLAQTCSNYGSPSDGSCLCPAGFNSPSTADCALPVCGGSLYTPAGAAPGGTGGFGNVSTGCGCSDGWTGPGCTVCTSSPACTNSLTRYLNSSTSLASSSLNSTLTCSNAPTVYSTSQLSCNVIQQTLQSLFPLASTATITRSLNTSRTPGGQTVLREAGLTNADGEVFMQLWYDGVEQFYCMANGCSQTVGTDSAGGSVNASTWQCPTLNCTCRTGTTFCGGGSSPSQNLTGAINVLKGPLTIDCFGGGTCNFKQMFLQALFGSNGLELSSCSIGECVEQFVIDQALGITSTTASSDGLSGGVIAGLAVVGAILLAIIGVLIWGFMVRRKARKTMRTDGVLDKSGGVGIAWEGVGYEVQPATRGSFSKVGAWLKGVGTQNPPRPEEEKGGGVGPNGGKIVLRDSAGQIPAGGFCCILGPSGAGKSTLVDVLAGKRKTGKVQGRVGFTRQDGGTGRVKIGYVDQSDVLSPTSTVLETLLFAANLRLPESIPSSVKAQRAHEVLDQLHLTHIADTRIGSSDHRGISGGEARRVSIGIELVAAPDVLVLDEPTSGLDSVSASRLVKLLKGLAEEGTTIIASIHQPSSALYHAFDQVVLLSGGRQLYFGPGGSRPAEYFAKQGMTCPEGYNVADHLLEIASGPVDGVTPSGVITTDDDRQRSSSTKSSSNSNGEHIQTLNDGSSDGGSPTAEKHISYPPTSQSLLRDSTVDASRDLAGLGASQVRGREAWWKWPRSHCATTFLTQVEILSGREWRNLKRDKTLFVAHTLLACILGVFAGGLYYKVGITIAGFQNRVGSLFFLGSLIAFSSLSALYNLVEVRSLFLRERSGNFYSPQAWLLSRVIFDVIPLRLIPTILVSIIVYFMVGLAHDAARFFKFLLIIVEFSLGMTLFNFLLACLFTHGGVAILLSSLCNLFLMTYAGFFVNISQIPPVLRWLRYFSTLGYTLEALAINEVGSGLQIVDSLNGVKVEIGAVIIMQTLFGFNLGNYYRDVLVLFAFIAGFGVLLIGVVGYVLRERR
ncbi:hypothetical protein CI109_102964 [Kwoniella shandongensis]|uniref:Uncharacterized protein n=1 Tax=Kwoniella shandongensis TaxID=1734106 RepID=A0A5M6CBW6_9TREE|nr:uncharacterized protein CI109_000152 [Kwoniella shandongensis]KAA5531312.1 hypothetical protein CI109_000152 [Kwoniella shandongensis]